MPKPPSLHQTVCAEAIVAIRIRSGITRQALAEAAEIDRSQLWRIETGKAPTPRVDTVKRLADALGVPVSAILQSKTSAA